MSNTIGRQMIVAELIEHLGNFDAGMPVMVRDRDLGEHPVASIDTHDAAVFLEIDATPETDLADATEELEQIVRALAESGARSALSERARAALGMPLKVKPAAA